MRRCLLLLCALLWLWACRNDGLEPAPGSSPANVEPPKDGTHELYSIRIEAALNPGIGDDIVFQEGGDGVWRAMHLPWRDGSSPEMFIPTVQFRGKRLLVAGEAVSPGQTPVSFASAFSFVVEAEDGSTQAFPVDLNFPQINTELAVLRVSPDREITSKTTYVQADASLTSPRTTAGWWTPSKGRIEIRGRGNSTWLLPKKPYRIRFPEKFSPIGLRHTQARSWVILGQDMDKSLIRNALAWDMSRVLFDPAEGYHDPLAILFTPCCEFVNLYMGREYKGVYQFTDQLQRHEGRIYVDKLTQADGSASSLIEGGYIVEANIHGESAPVRFYSPQKHIQLDHKYPDEEDYDASQYAWIENYIGEAEKVLYGSSFKNATTGWRAWFDERTLADYIIIKELAGDMDGYTSTWMYKRRGSPKIFFGPIWDVDKGWDNEIRTAGVSDKANSLMIYAGFKMPNFVSDDWFQRFWADETFRAFVNARWISRRDALISAIERGLDLYPALMPKAVEANYTVWPFYYQASTEAKMPAATYPEEIQRIRSITHQRAAVLDRLFAQ